MTNSDLLSHDVAGKRRTKIGELVPGPLREKAELGYVEE